MTSSQVDTFSSENSYCQNEIIEILIEKLEVIQSQVEDENISVKKHFCLCSKALGLIEFYMDLYSYVPDRLREISDCIADSFFS